MIATGKATPAVAYYRMSSAKQDKSIDEQREIVEPLAAKHGCRIIRWKPYVDEAISGDEAEKRPGFQRLIQDAQEKRDFEIILVWDQDRFSRFDPLEANHYWYLLRQAGVRIISFAQGELELASLGGWLTASIDQHGKHQYLKDLSRNVVRGRYAKARKGEWSNGRACYGYALVEGKLVLGHPEHIRIVRWLFETYSDTDTSLADMANQLNSDGIPSPRGALWTIGGIQHILRRKTYLGKAVQFRQQKGKYYTVRDGEIVPVATSNPIVKPEDDWLTMDCPTIIDQNLWDRAQEKLRSRQHRTTPKRGGGRALLTGLLWCSHCGKRMHAAEIPRRHSNNDERDLIYVCSTYTQRGRHGCHRNPIHEAAILDYLIEKIRDSVLSPANFDRLRNELVRQVESRQQSEPADMKQKRSRLRKLDQDIKAAASELKRTPDDLYDLAVADLRELRAKRDRLAGVLEGCEHRAAARGDGVDAQVNKALERLHTLRERIMDADPRVSREALHRVCERIDLSFEHTHHKQITRSYFKKGLVKFQVQDLKRQPGLN